MKFKLPHMKDQYEKTPQSLKEICEYFDALSKAAIGKEGIVTRVSDPVEGESGVHRDFRAVDFRDEHVDSVGQEVRLFNEDEAQYVVDKINEKFPRHDKKLTCIHHSFNGGKLHFHLQVPAANKAPISLTSMTTAT